MSLQKERVKTLTSLTRGQNDLVRDLLLFQVAIAQQQLEDTRALWPEATDGDRVNSAPTQGQENALIIHHEATVHIAAILFATSNLSLLIVSKNAHEARRYRTYSYTNDSYLEDRLRR